MKLSYEINPTEDENSIIFSGLTDFNVPYFGDMIVENFGCFIRNVDNKIVGGITGYTIDAVAIVQYVWIDESIRGRGYGYQLFELLEAEIKAKKVEEIHLNTYSFQAPNFYLKLGFKEVARYQMMKKDKIDKIFYIKEIT